MNRPFFFAAAILLLAGCTPAPIAPGGSGAVACTMEAKLCPDGSYVGRTGPDCQFAPCPSTSSAALDSVSDGTIAFSYDQADFGLATTTEQVLAGSYIPPCEPGFAYCLYYKGDSYNGTNFDGAGLGISERTDLGTANCLTAAPDGYNGLTPATQRGDGYATSLFGGLGDAGAGHYARDQVYRLQTSAACYELRTRIGATQYANYEPGTIREFTAADEAILAAKLRGHLGRVTQAGGKTIVFPSSGSGAVL